MSARLEGKVCLLMGGGSSGQPDMPSNGEAVARMFGREGARVAVVDIDLAAATASERQIQAEGGQAIAIRADVSRHDQVKAAVQTALDVYGRIDILYNNVGIEAPGDVVSTSEEAWDQVHAVNLKSVFLACKEVVPLMAEQGGGAIVNVSSLASLRWGPAEYIAYNSSKAALNHMSRVMARQYAPKGIRCNVIVPGMIATPHVQAMYQDKSAEEFAAIMRMRNAHCPMGRQGSPWDIAHAAVFLASDEAAYVSGVLLEVDGALGC